MQFDLLNKIDYTYTTRKLEEMIAIPSVVREEKELAHYLQNELEALGLFTELHEVESGRPNIYGKLKGDKPGKRLNFNGHLDTVPVVQGWDTDPYKAVKKEGKIYGLGSNDMKGGIACALSMLKAFSDSDYPINGEITFAGVIDEEAYGEGAKAMLKTDWKNVNGIILGEPDTGEKDNPRARPGETVESVIKDMENLVASLNLDARVEVKTKPPLYASYVLERTHPFVELFDSTYRDIMGKECYYEYSSSISDANTYVGEGGIPCMHLGPSGGNTHQKNEYTILKSLIPVTKFYVEFARRFLS